MTSKTKQQKEKPKVSSRTQYRKLRRQLLKDCITELINLLDLKEKDLEKIKIPFFKKLRKAIADRHF
jgi:hypothetical protein